MNQYKTITSNMLQIVHTVELQFRCLLGLQCPILHKPWEFTPLITDYSGCTSWTHGDPKAEISNQLHL